MIYTGLTSLCEGILSLPESDKEGREKLSELIRVYFKAHNNPPSGIIGVGAITYAEQVLIAYQTDKEEKPQRIKLSGWGFGGQIV